MKSLNSLREKAKSLKDDQERSNPKETTSPQQKKDHKKRVKKSSDASPRPVNVWEEYPEFVPLDYQPSSDVLRHITGHELIPSTLVATGFSKLLEMTLRCHYLFP